MKVCIERTQRLEAAEAEVERLQALNLYALCTRAPWSGVSTRGWGNDDEWELTEADIRAAYAAIVAGASKDALCAALGVDGLSRDKAARCLGLLKGAGLIHFVKGTGWVPRGTA